MLILLMGVTGSGKSTIGKVLAKNYQIRFIDADDFHPKENIAFMSEGKPLNDEMRKPWLNAIAFEIKRYSLKKKDLVLACSALKRAYRKRLFESSQHSTLIYLKGSRQEIGSRLSARKNHFMPSTLAESQFQTLEEPDHYESAIVVPVALTVDQAVIKILCAIQREHLYFVDPEVDALTHQLNGGTS